MDTTDPEIRFNQDGICNHCRQYDEVARERLYPEDVAREKLDQIITEIKEKGKNKQYDCLMGVSGGVDSTYVIYNLKKLGLKPLAVHVDNGWNTQLAYNNIKKILQKLNIDLYTYVLDWNEFRDLQLSFLKASVPDLEIPTDHAIVSVLMQVAAENDIQYIISGTNIVTEIILPRQWSHGHADWRYIKSIHNMFGKYPLKKYPHLNLYNIFNYTFIKGQRFVHFLNYVHYNKNEAMKLLQDELDWQYYGGKHYESIYTRFVQGYILPKKFNFDKRRAHLSNLICSNQMTRTEAIKVISEKDYSLGLQEQDRKALINKFELTENEFEDLLHLPNKSFWDYPSYEKIPLIESTKNLYRKYIHKK